MTVSCNAPASMRLQFSGQLVELLRDQHNLLSVPRGLAKSMATSPGQIPANWWNVGIIVAPPTCFYHGTCFCDDFIMIAANHSQLWLITAGQGKTDTTSKTWESQLWKTYSNRRRDTFAHAVSFLILWIFAWISPRWVASLAVSLVLIALLQRKLVLPGLGRRRWEWPDLTYQNQK